MDESDLLAERFERSRGHLRAVAYRMLGSTGEADDAVQEAWLRLTRSDAEQVEDMRAWLTTVVARISLDMLRSRRSRREEPFDVRMPEPIVGNVDGGDPEHEVLLADSVGLALQVVLETLPPAERLAFVLHDMFGVPFDEIAPIVDRTPVTARQLASRARRRVRGEAPPPDDDPGRRREVVNAYIAAAREGDFDRLLTLLDPDVVLRADGGTLRPDLTREELGAEAVVGQARTFAHLADSGHAALVNGAPGVVVAPGGAPFAVIGFTVRDGLISEIDILADPERLERLDLSFIEV